jgi:hypothetical protein
VIVLRHRLALGAVVALASCADPPDTTGRDAIAATAAADTPWLRTDSSAYGLRRDARGWGTTIGFTYENRGRDTVYVTNCNGALTVELQKKGVAGWTRFWFGATNGCASAPIVILPGAQLRDSLHIWGAEPENTSTETFASTDFSGSYRLVWHQPVLHYASSPPFSRDTLPEAHRVSNEFSLAESPILANPSSRTRN